MAVSIPFNFISPSTLVPGFFFEIHPFDNTGLAQFQTLLVGQVLSTGSLGPITAATSATSASGTTLTFTSVPAGVVPGMNVLDVTASSAIPAGTTVVSKTSTTVVVSAAVTSVGSADTIRFTPAAGPVFVSSVADAKALFGEGSMLARMVAAYRSIDTLGTLYALPLYDDIAASKATGTITISGTVSSTQTLSLYVGGIAVPLQVTSTMTNANIAVALVSAINATPNMPVVASGSTFPITLTARHAGLVGNDVDIRLNYYGGLNGEATPVGLTFSSVAMSGGSTNPDLAVPLTALGQVPFDLIAGPYSAAGDLDDVGAFLSDASGRWGPFDQLFGHYMTVAANTVGNLTTLGTGANDQHISVFGTPKKTPTPPDVLSALVAANASVSLRADPGVPLNGLELVGALAPAPSDQFILTDRQTLLADGVATLRVAPGNKLCIERAVTTYTTDVNNFADTSYQNAEKMFSIAYAVKYFAGILSNRFQRAKLAHDGARVPVGSNMVTPSTIRGSCIAIYGDLCDQGIMDGGSFDNFTKNVVVQINSTNRNMVDIMLPVVPIHQLETVRVSLQLVP